MAVGHEWCQVASIRLPAITWLMWEPRPWFLAAAAPNAWGMWQEQKEMFSRGAGIKSWPEHGRAAVVELLLWSWGCVSSWAQQTWRLHSHITLEKHVKFLFSVHFIGALWWCHCGKDLLFPQLFYAYVLCTTGKVIGWGQEDPRVWLDRVTRMVPIEQGEGE